MAEEAPVRHRYDSTVREFLSYLIGQQVVEITQHDPDEFRGFPVPYVMLHFASGATLRCWLHSEGVDFTDPATGLNGGFTTGSDDDEEEGDRVA